MSRFYSSRVSRKGNTKTTGGEIGKEKWTEGKGPWLGSQRHWGPGRDGIHRLAVLVYRGSLRSSYYAPFLVPHLARPTLLAFSPCFYCFDDTLPSLSLSHADPLERTRFYLSLSPVNGLCRPAPRFSIVFLSLSLFRFHLLSPYNSVRKEPRVASRRRREREGPHRSWKNRPTNDTGISAMPFLSVSLKSFAFTFFQRCVVACNDFMFALIDDLVPPPREDR